MADLRAARARYPDDERLTGLIRRLVDTSAEFSELWANIDVGTRRSTRKRLRHPEIGWLVLDCDALHDPETDHWLILCTAPVGSRDREALRLLGVLGAHDFSRGS